MNIFVGNLPFEANEEDVKKLFEGFGDVLSVVIVMEKQKTAPKSRGFGFVDIPDEAQALAAIAGLNAKEFMGRLLNVGPARTKEEAQASRKLKEKNKPKPKPQLPQVRFSRLQGTYKGGRRTRSYMKRKGLIGMQEEAKPRKGFQDNPMRWRKRKDQAKPWQKGSGEQKPWKKTEGEAKPWKKSIRLAQKYKLKVSKKRESYKNS